MTHHYVLHHPVRVGGLRTGWALAHLFYFSPKEKIYLFVLKNTHTYFVLIYIQEALSGCTGSDGCQCKQFVKVAYTADCYSCGHLGKHHKNVGRISVEGAIH